MERQQSQERVVVTGVGTVSALGLGIDPTLENLRRNQVCLSPVTRFPLRDTKSRLVGQVPEFKAAEVDRRIDFSQLNPISRFAAAAGRNSIKAVIQHEIRP